jgi:hypothetical protein
MREMGRIGRRRSLAATGERIVAIVRAGKSPERAFLAGQGGRGAGADQVENPHPLRNAF